MTDRRLIPGGRLSATGKVYRRDPQRPYHPAVPLAPSVAPPIESVDNSKKVNEKLSIDTAVMQNKLLHRSPDESIDIMGFYQNDVLHGIPPDAINVIVFTVPDGCVAMIDQIAVYYSDPLVAMSTAIGWRLTIDNGQVSNIKDPILSYMYSGFSDLSAASRVHPVWVQSGQTIALQANPSGTFAEAITITCRISGKLFKPATPEIMGI